MCVAQQCVEELVVVIETLHGNRATQMRAVCVNVGHGLVVDEGAIWVIDRAVSDAMECVRPGLHIE